MSSSSGSSSSTKQAGGGDEAAEQPSESPFSRRMTISKSGRYRESQKRRGSLFDEKGNTLFGAQSTTDSTTQHQKHENKTQLVFTMAL